MELDQLGQPTMFIRVYKIQGTQRVTYMFIISLLLPSSSAIERSHK